MPDNPIEDALRLTTDPYPLGGEADKLADLQSEGRTGPDPLWAVWRTDTGALNRLIALWRGAQAAATEDARPHDWLSEQRTTHRLRARRSVRSDLFASPCLELRMYAPRPGQFEAFLALMLGALPYRERYSPLVGLWTCRESGVDLVAHLWAYRDARQRHEARSQAAADSDWAAYRKAIPHLLGPMRSTLLTPVFSASANR